MSNACQDLALSLSAMTIYALISALFSAKGKSICQEGKKPRNYNINQEVDH